MTPNIPADPETTPRIYCLLRLVWADGLRRCPLMMLWTAPTQRHGNVPRRTFIGFVIMHLTKVHTMVRF